MVNALRLAPEDTAQAGVGHAWRVSRLPVLREVRNRWPMPPVRLVLVAHVLDTAVPYVRVFGESVEELHVVPVPYSVRPEALALLGDVSTRTPTSIDEVGRLAVEAATRLAGRPGPPVVIQEVGGYCADAVDVLARLPGFRGVVEDTKQGQWRYEQRTPLPLPVFTIADSPLKALEDVQVGRSVAYSVERLLRLRFYRILSERRVLVLGYGGIGTALAEHLRRAGAEVAVYDPSEVRMSAAVVHGFRVGTRKELLPWAEVVVGVSGHRSVSVEDLPLLRDGVVLASGSSKQVEFDVEGLTRAATSVTDLDEVRELRVADRTVFLLNDGKPVNFLEQSILGSVLDLVYSELYLCTRQLARQPHLAGLHRLSPGLQQQLAQCWREEYGRK